MKKSRYKVTAAVIVTLMLACSWADAQSEHGDGPEVVAAAAPVYPAIARAARVSGEVVVTVEIDRDGGVTSVKSEGHKLLQPAAELYARRWKFRPAAGGAGMRTARLVFAYRIIEKKAEAGEATATFMPPYKVEVASELPRIQALTSQ